MVRTRGKRRGAPLYGCIHLLWRITCSSGDLRRSEGPAQIGPSGNIAAILCSSFPFRSDPALQPGGKGAQRPLLRGSRRADASARRSCWTAALEAGPCLAWCSADLSWSCKSKQSSDFWQNRNSCSREGRFRHGKQRGSTQETPKLPGPQLKSEATAVGRSYVSAGPTAGRAVTAGMEQGGCCNSRTCCNSRDGTGRVL